MALHAIGLCPQNAHNAHIVALLAGAQDEAERLFEQCEENAVRFGGSNAQRGIISATRVATRRPTDR